MPIEVPDELLNLTHLQLMARLLAFDDEVRIAAAKLHEFGASESGSKHALEILDRARQKLYE